MPSNCKYCRAPINIEIHSSALCVHCKKALDEEPCIKFCGPGYAPCGECGLPLTHPTHRPRLMYPADWYVSECRRKAKEAGGE